MSSLTTRLKMNVPAPTDLADPAVYYNPNLAIIDTELPSILNLHLPATPDYDGQIRTSSGDGWSKLTASAYNGKWYNVGNFQVVGTGSYGNIGMVNSQGFVDNNNTSYPVTYNGSSETWGSPIAYNSNLISCTAIQSFIVKLSTIISASVYPATGFLNFLLGNSTTPPTQANNQAIIKLPIASFQFNQTTVPQNFDFSVIPGFAVKSFSVIPSATAGTLFSISNGITNYRSNRVGIEVYNR